MVWSRTKLQTFFFEFENLFNYNKYILDHMGNHMSIWNYHWLFLLHRWIFFKTLFENEFSILGVLDSQGSKGVEIDLCLVFLCVQNSYGRSKMVLVWPNWFGLDHNDLVSTKMKWSQPKWIGQVQIVIFYQNESHLDLTNSFWSWPFHFGRDQIIMVKSKSIWSDQNHFGPTKTVLVK